MSNSLRLVARLLGSSKKHLISLKSPTDILLRAKRLGFEAKHPPLFYNEAGTAIGVEEFDQLNDLDEIVIVTPPQQWTPLERYRQLIDDSRKSAARNGKKFYDNHQDLTIANALHEESKVYMIGDLSDEDPTWFRENDVPSKDEVMVDTMIRRLRDINQRAKAAVSRKLEDEAFLRLRTGVDKSFFKPIFARFNKKFTKFGSKDSATTHGFSRVRPPNAPQRSSYCDASGFFICPGPGGQGCTHKHAINPYLNKSQRDRFRLWHLDHQIQLWMIVDQMIQGAVFIMKKKAEGELWVLDEEYLYRNLFTTENLLLVHVECHMNDWRFITLDQEKLVRRL